MKMLPVLLVCLPFIINGCASGSKPQAGVIESTDMRDPWFRAARSSDIAVLKGMVQGGQPIDKKTKAGTTALMVASREGAIETVKWLLENGASAAAVDGDDQSALVYVLVGNAPELKRARVVEELLKSGANPFLVDKLGFQPIQEMMALDMDDQVRKLKFTDKKPCDLVPRQRNQISLSKAARRLDKPELATLLEAEGCW